MNGTLASVLRAPAHEWPEILAREQREVVTVQMQRWEYEAFLAMRSAIAAMQDRPDASPTTSTSNSITGGLG